jgi:hypothetical protein
MLRLVMTHLPLHSRFDRNAKGLVIDLATFVLISGIGVPVIREK